MSPLNTLSEVGQIKVIVPNVAQQVIDMAVQLRRSSGLSANFRSLACGHARPPAGRTGPNKVHQGPACGALRVRSTLIQKILSGAASVSKVFIITAGPAASVAR